MSCCTERAVINKEMTIIGFYNNVKDYSNWLTVCGDT